jgi:hypothetical protein
MSVILQFIGGEELELTVDPDQWTDAYKKALRSSEVLEVRDADGRRLGVNPHAVLFWTLDSGSAPSPG